jgi:hypothetical protein
MHIELRRLALRTAMLLALALAVGAGGLGAGSTSSVDAGNRANRETFRAEMRTLWAGDHIVWTRCVIISLGRVQDPILDDFGATAARLHANQDAIGDAFRPFYGDAAADSLTALLHDHIDLAAEIILTVKSGGDPGGAINRWYENAAEIAALLHELNPQNWPEETVEALLRAHLDKTFEEAGARLAGDFEGDIQAYDRVHAQILTLADALSAGIIAQFPQAFAGG